MRRTACPASEDRATGGYVPAGPGGDRQQRDDHQDLQDRERRGGGKVQLLGGEQVDLGLDVGVAQPAHGEHDPERGRAEEEDDARRGDDAREQRRQRDRRAGPGPGEAPRAAAACSCRGSIASQKVPTVRTTTAMLKNARARTIATAVPSIPRNASGPDSETNWRNATPTTTVGSTNGTITIARRSESGRGTAAGAGRTPSAGRAAPRPGWPARRPQREEEDRPGAGAAEDVEDPGEVEPAVGPEAAGDHAADRQQEEDGDHRQRHQRRGHDRQGAAGRHTSRSPSRRERMTSAVRSPSGQVAPFRQPLTAVLGDVGMRARSPASARPGRTWPTPAGARRR